MTPKKEYTVKELSKALGKHPRTIFRWIYKHGMPCRKEKRKCLFKFKDGRIMYRNSPVYIIDFKKFMNWYKKC